MFCIKCGQQLPDDANFCAACGNKVFRSTPLSPTISNVEYDSVANKAEDIIINDEMQSLNVHHAGDVVREKAEFIGESNTYSNDDYNVSDRITPSSIAVNRGKYTKIEPYSEGLAAVERGGKWGFIDENGKEIIPIIYDSVQKAFDDSRIIWADRNGKMGFIDINGSVVFPFKYDLIFPMDYKRISIYNEQVGLHYDGQGIMARLNRKFGFVDITGKEVIPLKYDRVHFFKDGYAPVKLNDKWGIINKKGEEVIPMKYDEIVSLIKFGIDDILKVKLNGKYGFIYFNGVEIFRPQYDEISDFKGTVAIIKKNGKYGYIEYDEKTKSLQVKLDCILDYAGRFETTARNVNIKTDIYDWVALISFDGKDMYINRSFDKIFEPMGSLGILGELIILMPYIWFVGAFSCLYEFAFSSAPDPIWSIPCCIVLFIIWRWVVWPMWRRKEDGDYILSDDLHIDAGKIRRK